MPRGRLFVLCALSAVWLDCFAGQDCPRIWQTAVEADANIGAQLDSGSRQCLAAHKIIQRQSCWAKRPQRGNDLPPVQKVRDAYIAAIATCDGLETLRVLNARFLARVGMFCDAAAEFAAVRSENRLVEESDVWLGCAASGDENKKEEWEAVIADALTANEILTGDDYQGLRTKYAARILQNWIAILTWPAERRTIISSQASYLASLDEGGPIWMSWSLLLERAGTQWATSAETILRPARDLAKIKLQLQVLNKKLSGG